jgi:hypothetical protein
LTFIERINEAAEAYVAEQTAPLVEKNTAQAKEIAALKTANATLTEQTITQAAKIKALEAELEALRKPTEPAEPEPPIVVVPPVIEFPPSEKGGVVINIKELAETPLDDVHVGYAKDRADAEQKPTVLNSNDTQTDVNGTANVICAVLFPDKRDYYFKRAEWQVSGLFTAPTSRGLEYTRSMQAHWQTINLMKHLRPEWDDGPYRAWGMEQLTKELSGTHSGYNRYPDLALNLLNNHSNMALSALVAWCIHNIEWGTPEQVAKAKELLDKAVIRHRVFLGDLPRADAGWFIKVDPTGWLPQGANGGINPRGSTVRGQRPDGTPETIYVSGMEPMEYLRPAREIAIFPVPEGDSEYISEAKNAYVPAATILHRAGLVDFNAGDDAIQRAFDAIYWRGEVTQNWTKWERPLKRDDVWELDYVNWFAKKRVGKTDFYPTPDHDIAPGKGTGFGGLFWRWRYKGVTKAAAK